MVCLFPLTIPAVEPPHFYCPNLVGDRVELDEAEARHALQSLRLHAGDAVVLCDGRGTLADGTLAVSPTTKASKRRPRSVAVAITQTRTQPKPDRSLTLIVAGCKGPRLEWLVEKCTELGVTRLLLTSFDRSVVRTEARHATRLQRTMIEACKQCGRAWLPELRAALTLDEALAAVGHANVWRADPTAQAEPLGTCVASASSAIVIGPEGGFSNDEVTRMNASGIRAIGLGPHVLRVETAAVAAAAAWAATVPFIGQS